MIDILSKDIETQENKNSLPEWAFDDEKINKWPSKEEQNEFRDKLEEEKNIQKEKQGNQIEYFKAQLNENPETNYTFLNKILSNEWWKEFFDKLKKWQNSEKNIRNIKNLDLIHNMIDNWYGKISENIQPINIKWINIPIILTSKEKINKTTFDALLNLSNDIKNIMNKTLDYIVIWDLWINWEAEYEKGFWIRISNEYKSTSYANQMILHEFAHIQHFMLSLSNNNFNQKLEQINKWIEQSNLSKQMLWLFWQQKYIRKDTVLKQSYDENELAKWNLNQTIELKTWEKIISKNWDVLLWNKGELSLKNSDPVEIHKYLRKANEPRYWFISPYSFSELEKKPIWKMLWYEDIEIRSEELSNIVEEYNEDKNYFINIIIWNKKWKNLLLNEKYDNLSKYPLIRQKLRLMVEYWFFPKGEFDQYFEKIV